MKNKMILLLIAIVLIILIIPANGLVFAQGDGDDTTPTNPLVGNEVKTSESYIIGNYLYVTITETSGDLNVVFCDGRWRVCDEDGNVTVVDGFSAVAGDWDTVVLQVTMDAAGNIPKGTWGNFNFGAVKTTKLSFDNAKLYFKPYNATVELVANGAVVAT